ncbi:MAG: aldo/keto reductase [Myxococcota bacterium]|nr:aldo/keto reductase [Myxococcota bacterium]MEE2780361.1 aldo/keto reductase [Myxococcota bacterium]
MNPLSISNAPRTLGRSSLRSSPLAYGCWRFAGTDVSTARAKVEAALELGVTLFDHADIYGYGDDTQFGDAEALFGEVLAEAPELRDRMVIASKCGIIIGVPYDSSAAWITQAAEDSLRRLQVDVIDLYQIHRPDFLGHPAEIAEALTRLRSEGKIREVGVSNYSPSQVRALQAHLSFPIATVQPEFSCWRHHALRDGVLDQCLELQMTPLAWSPLGGGVIGLSPEEAEGRPDGARLASMLRVLDRIADEQGVSRTAVAMAWTMVHPAGVIPIIGTQRVERIQQCMDALKVEFTRTQWNEILVAAQGEPLP